MTTALPPARKLIGFMLRQAGWATRCLPATLDTFADAGIVRRLRRGENATAQGDRIDYLTLVLEGVLQVGRTSPHGKRFIAGYVGPGQLLDVVAFLDSGKAPNESVAYTDALVCLLSRPVVEAALASDPAFSRSLLGLLCARSRDGFTERADMLLGTLRQRCARTLMTVAKTHGIFHGEGVCLALRMNQADFADLVGWSRPIVNRELKRLEREGLVAISYAQLTILDVKRIAQIASGEDEVADCAGGIELPH